MIHLINIKYTCMKFKFILKLLIWNKLIILFMCLINKICIVNNLVYVWVILYLLHGTLFLLFYFLYKIITGK